MEIPLDPEIEAVVRRKVSTGEYPTIEELVEEALLLLVRRDWERTKADLLGRIGGEGLLIDPMGEEHPG